MTVILLGAALEVAGLVYLASAAIWRGRLSDPGGGQGAVPPGATLEPPQRGTRFLGLGPNWPGIVLLILGAILLLAGAFVQ